jgi:uncharacterized protein
MRDTRFRTRRRTAILAALLIAAAALPLAAQIPEGYRPRYVNDLAGVIDRREEARLSALATELEAKTGAEMAVLTVRSLEGRDIEGYANDLLVRWGIGKSGENNGVLIVAAIDDRRARIEVGYGLEPILPDGFVGGILDGEVLPRFREGRYGEGLYAGALAVARRIAREEGVELTGAAGVRGTRDPRGRGRGSPCGTIGSILFFILFLVFAVRHPFLAALLLMGRGGGFGGGFGGGLGGGSGGFGGFGGGLGGGGGASRSW